MEQTQKNQEHSRKNGRSQPGQSEQNQPSRAPGQDEEPREFVGSTGSGNTPYTEGNEQGISNRPAKEEHAFPESPVPQRDDLEVEPDVPAQQGGNRGGV